MIRRSPPKKYAGKLGHFCVTEEDTKPNKLWKEVPIKLNQDQWELQEKGKNFYFL